jgi:hypothetical protein
MSRFAILSWLFVVAGAAAPVAAASLEIKSPYNDAAVAQSTVTIRGETDLSEPTINFKNNGESVGTALVNNGHFQLAVALQEGPNLIEASAAGTKASLLLFRVTNVSAIAPQKIRFVWSDNVEDVLKAIARATVDGVHGASQLNAYVAQVKAQTTQIFSDYYRGVANLQVIDVDGADVTTININPLQNSGAFGRTDFDCQNVWRRQTAWVFPHHLLLSMRDSFSAWEPMTRNDTLPQRANDVAESLARTAAHEVGHALGLTGNSGLCSWMEGDSEGHNSEAVHYRAGYAHLARRFDRGWYVMDLVTPTDGHIRIGQFNRHDRLVPRRGSFERFGASYLSILLPPQ